MFVYSQTPFELDQKEEKWWVSECNKSQQKKTNEFLSYLSISGFLHYCYFNGTMNGFYYAKHSNTIRILSVCYNFQ